MQNTRIFMKILNSNILNPKQILITKTKMFKTPNFQPWWMCLERYCSGFSLVDINKLFIYETLPGNIQRDCGIIKDRLDKTK